MGARRFISRLWIACSLFAAGTAGLVADEFRTAAVSMIRADWRGAVDELRSEIGTTPSVIPAFTFANRRRLPGSDPRSTPALVQLNAVTSQIFTGIGRSAVPVLLPFDTAAYLDAQWSGGSANLPLSHFQADFHLADLFDAGPAG